MVQIKSGLPYKTFSATNKDGKGVEFSVSTEAVQELIIKYLDAHQGRKELKDECDAFEAFDDKIMYYVPDGVFLGGAKDLMDFLNEMDDQGYK